MAPDAFYRGAIADALVAHMCARQAASSRRGISPRTAFASVGP